MVIEIASQGLRNCWILGLEGLGIDVLGTEAWGIEVLGVEFWTIELWGIDIWVADTLDTEDSGINMWGIETFVEVAFVRVCTS